MEKEEIKNLIKECKKRHWEYVQLKAFYKADQIKHKIKLLRIKLRE